MRVRIYYNLNKAVWSIKAMEGPFYGKVIAYAKAVTLDDAHTVVSQAGRERVLRERKKNVHAYIDGTLNTVQGLEMRQYPVDLGNLETDEQSWVPAVVQQVKYNPFQVAHFYWEHDGETTEHQTLDRVLMTAERKVFAVGEHLYS